VSVRSDGFDDDEADFDLILLLHVLGLTSVP